METRCSCMACRNQRWVSEWAEGEDVPRPPDEIVKQEVRRMLRSASLRDLLQEARTEATLRRRGQK